MTDDAAALYSAYASRDPRFDGVFFVGVVSTGTYCRPVCTAKMPRAANCRFFTSAAAAERAGLRPCLRCRPELAPGNAPVDGGRRTADRIAERIAEGMLDEGGSLEAIAAEFHMSSRHVRRVLRNELGVSPMELVMTRRLLLAKQLLTETALPVIEVAYSSGFSSLRRFNDAFRRRYRMPPTRLRREAAGGARATGQQALTLGMSYRQPYDWAGLLAFLEPRAIRGVECVRGGEYLRTVRLGDHRGWIRVRNAPRERKLLLDVSHSLAPTLPTLLTRLKHLFDLSARPDVIAAHLGRDPRLADTLAASPGLRVPGAFDGFELAMRAILGQQVTVKGASTLAARFAAACGEPIDTPYPELALLTPTPERVANGDPEELASLGIVRARARAMIALAGEVAAGRLHLETSSDPESAIERLVALPGIGPWTAQYIAMRALHSPDAFPREDAVLRKRLGDVSPARAEELAQPWQPWRSYAALHLWRSGPQSHERAAAD